MKTNRRDKYEDYSTDYLESVIVQWVRGKQNRDIFRLWLIDEYSYEQVAEILNISDKTVGRCIRKYDGKVFLHL